MPTRMLAVAAALFALAAPVRAERVDSDLGAEANRGGCRPPGVAADPFALATVATLLDPPYAPVVKGRKVPSAPVLVHGTVVSMHGERSGDQPVTRVRGDYAAELAPDAADAGRLATGNGDTLRVAWEAGAYPAWAWASAGDRLVALGRWVFDCGTPGAVPGRCSVAAAEPCVVDADCRPPACATCGAAETCEGEHFGYPAELHPPHATAAIRRGRGAVLTANGSRPAVPATIADVYVSGDGGGAGDGCLLKRRKDPLALLDVECFPLDKPVAQLGARNFVFDLPLPPGSGTAAWRVGRREPPGGRGATVRVKPKLTVPEPFLRVRVLMTTPVNGRLPTGFAGTIAAGWTEDPTPLTHVRVTLQEIAVANALQPVVPSVPKTCAQSGFPCESVADCDPGEACLGQGAVQSWRMQAAVNGAWQELTGLGTVDPGALVVQELVWDQYLPADGTLRLEAHGVAHECREGRLGTSLRRTVEELGLANVLACLATPGRDPGTIDVSYAGPDFGAGVAGSADFETISTGGDGGSCSLTTIIPCVVDADCPGGETCVVTGGAFALRYRIERLP